MKRNLLIILLTFCLLIGCSLGNTPTSQTEAFLTDYQMLKNVNIDYKMLSDDTNISDKLRNQYEKLIEKQYQNFSYEVKDEKIDGDNAIVTVEIEVTDYRKVIDKYNRIDYSVDEYHSLVIEKLENANEKVVYTIDFNVIKDEYGTWKLQSLSEDDRDKLLGIK